MKILQTKMLLSCAGFFYGYFKNGELFMEETKKKSMGDPHTAVRRIRAKTPSLLPQPLSWACRPYPAA